MIIAMNDKAMSHLNMDLELFISKSAVVQQAIVKEYIGIEYANLFKSAEALEARLVSFCDKALDGYIFYQPTTRSIANIRELKKALEELRESTTKYVLLRMLAPMHPSIKLNSDDVINGLLKVSELAEILKEV